MVNWHNVESLYNINKKKIKHIPKKVASVDWVGINCVYKIKINNKVIHVGRSDTCKKHGGAEKTRKALVQLMGWETTNPGITTTKLWESIKKTYKPKIGNIRIGIIATNDIERVYNKEVI
jgi:hypothetical protein